MNRTVSKLINKVATKRVPSVLNKVQGWKGGTQTKPRNLEKNKLKRMWNQTPQPNRTELKKQLQQEL